jgi:hypothetical protein
VGDFTPARKTAGETEDLFPEGYHLAAVRKAYGEIDLSFNAKKKQIPNIIDRLTALYERKSHGTLRSGEPTGHSPTPSTPPLRPFLPRRWMRPPRSSRSSTSSSAPDKYSATSSRPPYHYGLGGCALASPSPAAAPTARNQPGGRTAAYADDVNRPTCGVNWARS